MPKISNIGVCKNTISNVDVSKKTTAVYQASANYPFHQKRGWRKSSPFYLGRTNQTTNQIWGSSTFPALPPDSIHYMILDTSYTCVYVCVSNQIHLYKCECLGTFTSNSPTPNQTNFTPNQIKNFQRAIFAKLNELT